MRIRTLFLAIFALVALCACSPEYAKRDNASRKAIREAVNFGFQPAWQWKTTPVENQVTFSNRKLKDHAFATRLDVATARDELGARLLTMEVGGIHLLLREGTCIGDRFLHIWKYEMWSEDICDLFRPEEWSVFFENTYAEARKVNAKPNAQARLNRSAPQLRLRGGIRGMFFARQIAWEVAMTRSMIISLFSLAIFVVSTVAQSAIPSSEKEEMPFIFVKRAYEERLQTALFEVTRGEKEGSPIPVSPVGEYACEAPQRGFARCMLTDPKSSTQVEIIARDLRLVPKE